MNLSSSVAAVLSLMGVLGAFPMLDEARAADPLPLSQVRFWGYQIQQVDADGAVDDLAESCYDMLVLEPTRTDWTGSKDFDTAGMVTRLKGTMASDGVHRKLVIAYIDIGQAEDWRWYWTWSKTGYDCENNIFPPDWPDYIIACDPDGWGGNYNVAYWDAEWKDLVLQGTATPPTADRNFRSIVDEVILDGFDGVYLDWVEGFEDADVIAAAQAAGLDPAAEMVKFIGEIRAYGRARNPDFLVIQQNASSLINGHLDLLNQIDAIAQEGVWYDGDATDSWTNPKGHDAENDDALTAYYLLWLGLYKGTVPVFDCEYALRFADEAYALSAAEGFVPYATRRSLSQLTTTPPPDYPCATNDWDKLWRMLGPSDRNQARWQDRLLRRFRTQVLERHPSGRSFARRFYRNLPEMVIRVSANASLRERVRSFYERERGLVERLLSSEKVSVEKETLEELSTLAGELARDASPSLRHFCTQVQREIVSARALARYGVRLAD